MFSQLTVPVSPFASLYSPLNRYSAFIQRTYHHGTQIALQSTCNLCSSSGKGMLMRNDTELEQVTAADGRVASTPVRVPTDSRVVPDATSRTGYRGDIGSKGEQFILASWATLAAGLWVLISPWVLTFAGYAPDARANSLT